MPIAKENAISMIMDLVGRYEKHRQEHLTTTYNETQLRNDYLNTFLEILGWDVQNIQRKSSYLREVIQEETVDVEDEVYKKKPDYTIRIDGQRKYFLEAKKPSVNVLRSSKPAFQTRRYGWNANLSISVLFNFENLVIYDCRFKPEVEDDVRVARLHIFFWNEYVAKFNEIYTLLSRDSILNGNFDAAFKSRKLPRGAEPFDSFFLDQIEKWRESLAIDLINKNTIISQPELNYLIQQTINRIIFLRICEDRDLEKYEGLKGVKDYESLKKRFIEADKKYDSGLFDFIEDKLSLEIMLDAHVLINIFNDLYYPQNPYTFSVVDPRVLGEIYELFLSKELIISQDNSIVIRAKPEIVQSHGVVPTPQYIVDKILSQTIIPALNNKSPQELSPFRVADISCGSGNFLLAAYELIMNHYFEWYIKNTPTAHPEHVFQLPTGEWKLTLNERTRILTHHIYGVDIDSRSVEVTKFSLLLKSLEDVHSFEVDEFIEQYGRPALPDIAANIQCGNSLVDSNYYNFNDKLEADGQLVEINPFDFENAFPKIMADGGFDIIIGNPPYLRIQNIVRYSPLEVEYYDSEHSPYESAKNDNYDKYYLFIERSMSLMRPGGLLGLIVPHKFMTIKAGKNLRQYLSSHCYVSWISHFGVNQIFEGRSTTYTCILILKKDKNPIFELEFVEDLSSWKHGKACMISTFDSDIITSDPWLFVTPAVNRIFERLSTENDKKLEDVADIFVGLQTSADKIYILKPTNTLEKTIQFTDMNGDRWEIERDILRPCLLDVPLNCWGRPKPNSYIIFPYRIDKDSRAQLYTQKEMEDRFPKCWDYLKNFKAELERRSIQGGTSETWYRFGRSQSLTKFSGEPKLIWPVLSLEPRYSYDDKNIVITGGGNGPYYALRPKPDSLSIFYILGILSHPVVEAFVRARSSKFRGGYGSHGKQYVANIPIKSLDLNNKNEFKKYHKIIGLTQELVSITEEYCSATIPIQHRLIERAIAFHRKRLFEMVEDIYNLSQEDLETIINFENYNDE